jgi:hypothetical protein
MNDTVNRKVIAKTSKAVLEGWHIFEAGAAALAVRGLFAALRATVFRQRW